MIPDGRPAVNEKTPAEWPGRAKVCGGFWGGGEGKVRRRTAVEEPPALHNKALAKILADTL
jgi:hypothetical protein